MYEFIDTVFSTNSVAGTVMMTFSEHSFSHSPSFQRKETETCRSSYKDNLAVNNTIITSFCGSFHVNRNIIKVVK